MTRNRSSRTLTSSQFRQRNRQKYHIPVEWLNDARIGMDQTLSQLRLSLGSSRPLTGSRPMSLNTTSAYKKHYRGLRYFCCMIGDYEGLLLLQEDAPDHFCPSLCASTLSNFIRFKRGEAGSVLVDAHGETVLDRKGDVIACQGGWKDPDNVGQLISAVSVLHAAREQQGQYFESCQTCWDVYHQDASCTNGCFHHLGKPRFWRTGDPSTSDVVQNTKRSSNRDSICYQSKGNFALMMNELIAIRQRLVSSGSLYDYQVWVMILIGAHLFLRAEEMEALLMEDFLLDLTAFDELGRVDQLVVKVHGKSEKAQAQGPVVLTLWRLDSHPMLCPVRALFLYVARSGITKGYLFGPKSVIDRLDMEPVSLDELTTHISYDEFNSVFFQLCNSVTGDENRNRYGTHTIRKTAYLYVIWGGGDLDHIRQGARHKTMKNAQLYYRDSAALLARAKRTGSHVLSLAPTWQPIFLENLQAARRIAVEGTHRSRLQSLPFLASSYVSDVLRVEIRSIALFQLVQVAERDIPNRSAFEELQALLASQAPALLEKINSLVSEIVFQRLEHRSECDVVAPPVQTRPPTNASAETVTVQPTKRGGSNSLDRRLGMATLRTTADKIMLLEEIEPTVPLRKSELTESARQFVNQILTPILTCYREHFCSDLAAFIGTWGANFSHSKLKTNCSVKNPCNT